MSFTLKDKLFSYFGVYSKREDTSKDVDGKGIGERYQEAIGEDYDEEVGPLIDEITTKVGDPKTCLESLIVYHELQVGMPLQLYDVEAFRRKMIMLTHHLTLIKGTLLSYQVYYNLIGVTGVTINLLEEEDPCCGQLYEIVLTGAGPFTGGLEDLIKKIAYYLKPLTATIDSITYNGNEVTMP